MVKEFEATPHNMWVVNLTELYNFARESQPQGYIGLARQVAGHMLQTLGLGTFGPVVPMAVTITTSKEKLIREWWNTVFRPQALKHVDCFCIGISEVKLEDHVQGTGTKWMMTYGLNAPELLAPPDARIPVTLVNRNGTEDPAWKVTKDERLNNRIGDNPHRLHSAMCAGDAFRFVVNWKALERVPVQGPDGYRLTIKERPQLWYFPREYASNLMSDVSDWLNSEDCHLPRNLTKLSLKQAIMESQKWHQRLEKRKAKEAAEKLNKMEMGHRTKIAQIQLSNVSVSVPESMTRRLVDDTLAVSWLRDKAALDYQSIREHHCVDSYAGSVEQGHCVILDITDLRGGRWTAEVVGDRYNVSNYGETIRSLNSVRQIRGPCNVQAPEHVRRALELFIKHSQLFIVLPASLYLHTATDKIELYRYPMEEASASSKSLMSVEEIRTQMRYNSSMKSSNHPYVTEIEVTVPAKEYSTYPLTHLPSSEKEQQPQKPYTIRFLEPPIHSARNCLNPYFQSGTK